MIDVDGLVGEDLLSEQDVLDSFQAFFDLEATFFKYGATFILRRNIEPINNDYRGASTNAENIEVSEVLVVPDKNDNDAEVQRLRKGTADFTEGVMYVYMRTLKRSGLLDSNEEVIIKSTRDTVTFQGQEYDIFGVNRVGPFVGGWVLAKFQIKREFKKL